MDDEDPPSSLYSYTQTHYASNVLVHTYKNREAPEHVYSPKDMGVYIEEGKRSKVREGEQLYTYLSSLPRFFMEKEVREVEKKLMVYVNALFFNRKKKKIKKKYRKK